MSKTGLFVRLAIIIAGASLVLASVSTERGQAPIVANVATTADTEACYSFTSETHGFDLRSRGNNDTRICFVGGGCATTYFTVPAGAVWSADRTWFRNAEGICFQNSAATDTIEIIAWR